MTIGELIKTSRKSRGLTQEQLSKVVGVSTNTISNWENGKRIPPDNQLEKLSIILNVSFDDVIEKETEEDSSQETSGMDSWEATVRVIDDLYEDNKSKGIIGVFASDVYMSIIEMINQKGNINEKDDYVKALQTSFVKEWELGDVDYFTGLTNDECQNYVKYKVTDILRGIFPSEVVYRDYGKNSYAKEIVFVLKDDLKDFEERIKKTKVYLSRSDNKTNPVEFSISVSGKQSVYYFDEEDVITDREYVQSHSAFFPGKSIEKECMDLDDLKRLSDKTNEASNVLLSQTSTKTMSPGKAAVVGHLVAGPIGAVYGYSKAQDKRQEINQKNQRYYQLKDQANQIRESAKFHKYTYQEKPETMFLSLPFGRIGLGWYKDDVQIRSKRISESRDKYYNGVEIVKFLEKLQDEKNNSIYQSEIFQNLKSVVYKENYEDGEVFFGLTSRNMDNSIRSELYFLKSDFEVYWGHRCLKNDRVSYFIDDKGAYVIAVGNEKETGYADRKAFLMFMDELRSIYPLVEEDSTVRPSRQANDDFNTKKRLSSSDAIYRNRMIVYSVLLIGAMIGGFIIREVWLNNSFSDEYINGVKTLVRVKTVSYRIAGVISILLGLAGVIMIVRTILWTRKHSK